ncbi:MAG: ribosome maturation factor RimM [Lachnospiraceae bacterium]|nr:ribosome maturation factor RimM [Lachnospiraceae bacterium]
MEEVLVNEEELLRVGGIITTHGIKGEVKIYPTTDDNKRFKKLKEVYMEDHHHHFYLLHVESCKFFKEQVILKFKEFADINEAEKYKKCDLYVDREHALPLEEGEYYIADLIGLDVVSDDDAFHGIITDVLKTGANDVYVIEEKETKKELLLPVIDECVLDVSLENKLVKIHILKGLL